MTLEESHPALTELLATYFHQDWRLEGDSIDELVDAFVADNVNDSACVRNALAQVAELLERDLPDDELTALTIRSGIAEINPKGWGLTTRGWLEAIRDRLRARLERSV